MPRPTIDYLNARKELRKGSDHSSKRAAHYAPDCELDTFELAIQSAQTTWSDFAIWAEASRQAYLNAIPGLRELVDYTEPYEEWR